MFIEDVGRKIHCNYNVTSIMRVERFDGRLKTDGCFCINEFKSKTIHQYKMGCLDYSSPLQLLDTHDNNLPCIYTQSKIN